MQTIAKKLKIIKPLQICKSIKISKKLKNYFNQKVKNNKTTPNMLKIRK